jgi:hypothetical protein
MIRPYRTVLLIAATACSLFAQAPRTPKAAAPIDLTGYWVSIVTEDWRYRMLTAPKGDYYSLPLNQAAIQAADAYTPTQADACKNYGAATIMRMPARLHITWENDTTLKVEIDAGKQTRIFPFGPPSASYEAGTGLASALMMKVSKGEPTMQGVSLAEWQTPQSTRTYWQKVPAQNPNTPGFPGINMQGPPPPPDPRNLGGTLKVVTTHFKAGFLRNNGVPYSANTVLTEYYDLHKEKNGDQWLVITSIVEDPEYLNAPWITSSHFKREPDGSKWDPEPCELILPNK